MQINISHPVVDRNRWRAQRYLFCSIICRLFLLCGVILYYFFLSYSVCQKSASANFSQLHTLIMVWGMATTINSKARSVMLTGLNLYFPVYSLLLSSYHLPKMGLIFFFLALPQVLLRMQFLVTVADFEHLCANKTQYNNIPTC